MDNNLKANCTELTKSYNFYYHAPENNDYSLESYNEILSFNSLEEFWVLDKFVRKDMIENGMFFIMSDPILPIWEDKNNINGGYWSLRVSKKDSFDYWEKILYYLAVDKLTENNDDLINGVSVSPKINNCIFKIWNSNFSKINNEHLRKDLNFIKFDELFYLQHKAD